MVRMFDSLTEYFNYYEEIDHEYNDVDVVDRGSVISADGQFKCKSYKTALRRFFKAIAGKFDTWGWTEEVLLESIENGYKSMVERYWNDEHKLEAYRTWGWHYGIEELEEGVWYIELTVGKH